MTTLEHSAAVLTDPAAFAVPFDVSRERVRRVRRGSRTGSKEIPALGSAAVARGRQVFATELTLATRALQEPTVDVSSLLRRPVGLSTTAALLPALTETDRAGVAELVLAWIDALGAVIAARRPPRRWSRTRRLERAARHALTTRLADAGVDDASAVAAALAAGIQVPIAAGSWLVTEVAARPHLQNQLREEPALVTALVWEILRLRPPTWLLPRVTTRSVTIGARTFPAYRTVVVSPIALGQLDRLVPGPESGASARHLLDPLRWRDTDRRPGAWLPFGAGPHACPGRNLGLAQLHQLASWTTTMDLQAPSAPTPDLSRGLAPQDARVGIRSRSTGE